MVAQKARRRPARDLNGDSARKSEKAGKTAAADQNKPTKSATQSSPKIAEPAVNERFNPTKSATANRPKSSEAVKKGLNPSHNSGSRFNVLEVDDEMELETNDTPQADGVVDEVQEGVDCGSDEENPEVVKETQMDEDGVEEQVRVCISTEGLAAGLRPLEKSKVDVKISAQTESVGPAKMGKKPLRDVTNKMEANHLGPGAIRSHRNTQGQKRPIKSPYEKPSTVKNPTGGAVRGRPPDPIGVDPYPLAASSPKPIFPNAIANFWEVSGADHGTEEGEMEKEEAVPMEIPSGKKSMEGAEASLSHP